MTSPSDLQPGREIGGYRIERKIGTGGMGSVYLATQLSMDRQVALKILYGSRTRQEEGLQDFVREARLLAKLDHPNIVTAFDFGEEEGTYYLAMAYVEGEDLADRLTRSGPVPENEALVVAKKVAEALRYAWEKHQMLHRDVNPSNIMIDRFGDVRIMDLGIGRNLADEAADDEDTLAGTPNYMSPEQASGSSKLDFRSDMYSLGATLYAMVTGVIPFDDEDPLVTIRQVLSDPIDPAHKVNASVSGAVSTLIQVMMGKAVADRFDSWSACVRKMDQILEGETLPAPALGKVVSLRPDGAKRISRKVVTPGGGGPHNLNVPGAHGPQKRSGGFFIIAVVLAMVAASGWWFAVHAPREAAAEAARAAALEQNKLEAKRLDELNSRFRQIQLLVKTRPPNYKEYMKRMNSLRNDSRGTDLISTIDQQVAIVKRKMRESKGNDVGEVKSPDVGKTVAPVVDGAAQRNAFSQLSDDVGAGVLRQDFRAVKKLLQNAELAQWNSEMQTTIMLWKASVRVLERFPMDLRVSLLADRGSEIFLQLNDGAERVIIRQVRGNVIDAGVLLQSNGNVLGVLPRTIMVDDLTEGERLQRLGSVGKEVAILKALWAMKRNDMRAVQTALDACDLPLAKAIRAHVPQGSLPSPVEKVPKTSATETSAK